jgi:integrase
LDNLGQRQVLSVAKRVKDSSLDTRASRSKLKVSGKPYYKSIGEGLHIGYRKNAGGGKWVVRRYVGDEQYRVETIAIADDIEDANGDTVLSFWQAQERARGKRAYAGPYRVRDAVEAYRKKLDGKASAYGNAIRFEYHVLPALGDELVDELTADKIREWHRQIAKSMPLIPGKRIGERTRQVDFNDSEQARKRKVTANRVLTNLKAALNHAFREGKATSDAAWRRVEPFENVERARNRYLNLAEVERVLNACDPEFRTLVRAALETGARYGELTRLRCADFNPDAGTLHIRESKSGKERHIVLTEDGQELFSQLSAGHPGKDPMFGKEWADSHQIRRMRIVCKRAHIQPNVGFHQLRHTWASHAVMGGMPLMVVARNLGHADTRMVEKHYGHLAQSYVADAVRKHAPRFGPVGKNNVTPMK